MPLTNPFTKPGPASSPFTKSSSASSTATTQVVNGSAFIAGLAVLENPRHPDDKKMKTIIFDAQFFLQDEPPLVAGLKFYNSHNQTFKDVTTAFVVGTFTTYDESKFNFLNSEVLKENEYNIVGEILWLSIASEPVDACISPFMITTGPVSRDHDTTDGQHFYLDINHWTPPGGNGSVPIQGYFGTHVRYSNTKKKPIPGVGTIASCAGSLTHTMRSAYGPTPARLSVDIDGSSKDKGTGKLTFSFSGGQLDSPSLSLKHPRRDTDSAPPSTQLGPPPSQASTSGRNGTRRNTLSRSETEDAQDP